MVQGTDLEMGEHALLTVRCCHAPPTEVARIDPSGMAQQQVASSNGLVVARATEEDAGSFYEGWLCSPVEDKGRLLFARGGLVGQAISLGTTVRTA